MRWKPPLTAHRRGRVGGLWTSRARSALRGLELRSSACCVSSVVELREAFLRPNVLLEPVTKCPTGPMDAAATLPTLDAAVCKCQRSTLAKEPQA